MFDKWFELNKKLKKKLKKISGQNTLEEYELGELNKNTDYSKLELRKTTFVDGKESWLRRLMILLSKLMILLRRLSI